MGLCPPLSIKFSSYFFPQTASPTSTFLFSIFKFQGHFFPLLFLPSLSPFSLQTPFKLPSNSTKFSQILSDSLKFSQIPSNSLKFSPILSKPFKFPPIPGSNRR
ncbi:MAG: hypothetical protein C6I01_04865 [Epsilonproteobacteria bacterium]|nr:hypothetical protein [Campylobacterota bacterium]